MIDNTKDIITGDNKPATDSSENKEQFTVTPEQQARFTEINNKYKDIDWVNRGMNPDTNPNIKNEDGTTSTHLLEYAEADGKYYVYPTIVRDGKGLRKLESKEAWHNAFTNKTAIPFDSEDEAKAYSKNGLINHTKNVSTNGINENIKAPLPNISQDKFKDINLNETTPSLVQQPDNTRVDLGKHIMDANPDSNAEARRQSIINKDFQESLYYDKAARTKEAQEKINELVESGDYESAVRKAKVAGWLSDFGHSTLDWLMLEPPTAESLKKRRFNSLGKNIAETAETASWVLGGEVAFNAPIIKKAGNKIIDKVVDKQIKKEIDKQVNENVLNLSKKELNNSIRPGSSSTTNPVNTYLHNEAKKLNIEGNTITNKEYKKLSKRVTETIKNDAKQYGVELSNNDIYKLLNTGKIQELEDKIISKHIGIEDINKYPTIKENIEADIDRVIIRDSNDNYTTLQLLEDINKDYSHTVNNIAKVGDEASNFLFHKYPNKLNTKPKGMSDEIFNYINQSYENGEIGKHNGLLREQLLSTQDNQLANVKTVKELNTRDMSIDYLTYIRDEFDNNLYTNKEFKELIDRTSKNDKIAKDITNNHKVFNTPSVIDDEIYNKLRDIDYNLSNEEYTKQVNKILEDNSEQIKFHTVDYMLASEVSNPRIRSTISNNLKNIKHEVKNADAYKQVYDEYVNKIYKNDIDNYNTYLDFIKDDNNSKYIKHIDVTDDMKHNMTNEQFTKYLSNEVESIKKIVEPNEKLIMDKLKEAKTPQEEKYLKLLDTINPNMSKYINHNEYLNNKEIPFDEFEKIFDFNKFDKGIDPKGFIKQDMEYGKMDAILQKIIKEEGITYNPQEAYDLGKEFIHAIGGNYTNYDAKSVLSKLLESINEHKALGSEFRVSTTTYFPKGNKNRSIEKFDNGVRLIIRPKTKDIKYAYQYDSYTGSTRVGEHFNYEYGVSETKVNHPYRHDALVGSVDEAIRKSKDAYPEYVIELKDNNWRIEYDDNVHPDIKQSADDINKLLDERYGSLEQPNIRKNEDGIEPMKLNEGNTDFVKKSRDEYNNTPDNTTPSTNKLRTNLNIVMKSGKVFTVTGVAITQVPNVIEWAKDNNMTISINKAK